MSNFKLFFVVYVAFARELCYNKPVMKLFYNKTSPDPSYYGQQGYRIGKKVTTKNLIKFGKHSDLLRITDDPKAYCLEKIAEWNREHEGQKISMEVKIDFSEKILSSHSTVSTTNRRNIGYFFLQKIYHDLSVSSFFRNVTQDLKITYDPDLVNRFLTYARILEPDSKLATSCRLDRYYEQPGFQYQHILRTMDILESNYDAYISHLYQHSGNIIKRDASVCYFDCTNYYFETETADGDYVDEVTGESVRGFRKYGPSKEHRPNPLVEMGLFMDSQGIPLSMCLASGSDNEQTLAVPLEKELVKMFHGKKFIYCADAGLGSVNIRKFNSMGGRAFIVTQSIKKLSEKLQKAVFNDCGYRLLSSNTPVSIKHMKEFSRFEKENLPLYEDHAYKIINADNLVDLGFYEEKTCKNGKIQKVKVRGRLEQRVIISFSRKMMEYQRSVRNRQIERAEKLLKTLDPETYKKGPNDICRFIKRVSPAEADKKKTNAFVLDREAIKKEEMYDGYYAVATNLTDDAKTVLEISSQRYKIEDCFRILKTNFAARPVYHSLKPRIKAHFLICYTALLIYRLLEAMLEEYCAEYDKQCGKKHDDPKERTHFTINEIIETLKNMEVTNMYDMCYMSLYNGSHICTALNSVFGLGLDKKYWQPKELNKKIKNISK